jgi:ferredoxin
MPRVRYEPRRGEPVEFDVGYGSNLYRAALGRSVSLFNGPMKALHCWGKGLCGACFVEVVEGAESLPDRTPVELRKLKKAPATVRLACQIPVKGDLVIRKPKGILRPRGGHAPAESRDRAHSLPVPAAPR